MNDFTWDLSFLYQGCDDPALRKDIEKVKALCKEAIALPESKENDASKLRRSISIEEEMMQIFLDVGGYIAISLAADARNEKMQLLQGEISNLEVQIQLAEAAIIRFIGNLGTIEALMKQDSNLRKYAFFLKEKKEMAKHLLPEESESWILRMDQDGPNAFAQLRDRLMGSHTVELNGKILPLPAVRGMAYDPDAKVRKDAYEAELASYKKVETAMAYCLGGIKGGAITKSEARHYPDVLTEMLDMSRMDRETLDAMWTAIREALPDFRRYLRTKAKLLGHKNGLPFYDLFAPVGEVTKTYTLEEAKELLVSTFNGINPEMGAFIEHAFEHRWIDFFPREGKEGGAFCEGFYRKGQSRVLTNFVGSFSDVSTIAHELGHAWHNRCLSTKPMLLNDVPMPLAETASIFNETLLSRAVMNEADEKTRFVILENTLMEATQTVVDIYSRFLFESAVVEIRKTHIPTAGELNQMMLNAQEQAYGDGLDPDVRHPGMWVCKSHYYMNGLNFYNFPYAFGLLFGLGVYRLYKEEGAAFLPKYNELLASCGSDTIANVAASVGIDVRSVDYWRSALNEIRLLVDEFCRLANC